MLVSCRAQWQGIGLFTAGFKAAKASGYGVVVGLPDKHIYLHLHGNVTVSAGSMFWLRPVVCHQFITSVR